MKELTQFLKIHAAAAKKGVLPILDHVMATPDGLWAASLSGARFTFELRRKGLTDAPLMFGNPLSEGAVIRKSFELSHEGLRTDGVLWSKKRIAVYDEFDREIEDYVAKPEVPEWQYAMTIDAEFVRFVKELLTFWKPDTTYNRAVYNNIYAVKNSELWNAHAHGVSILPYGAGFDSDFPELPPAIPMALLKTASALLVPGARIETHHTPDERTIIARITHGALSVTVAWIENNGTGRSAFPSLYHEHLEGSEIKEDEILQAIANGVQGAYETTLAQGDIRTDLLRKRSKFKYTTAHLANFPSSRLQAITFGNHYFVLR